MTTPTMQPFGNGLKKDITVSKRGMFGSNEFHIQTQRWNELNGEIKFDTPNEKKWVLMEDDDGMYLYHFSFGRKPYTPIEPNTD